MFFHVVVAVVVDGTIAFSNTLVDGIFAFSNTLVDGIVAFSNTLVDGTVAFSNTLNTKSLNQSVVSLLHMLHW